MKAMLARPIQLADEVAKQCAAARSFRAECAELKARADKLAALLRQAARAPTSSSRRWSTIRQVPRWSALCKT